LAAACNWPGVGVAAAAAEVGAVAAAAEVGVVAAAAEVGVAAEVAAAAQVARVAWTPGERAATAGAKSHEKRRCDGRRITSASCARDAASAPRCGSTGR